jgi:oxalate---CoA ligase
MNFLPTTFGDITDLTEDRHWSSLELQIEVARRSSVLSQGGVSPRSIVAISQATGAHFIADLLAVWACGATAACLDPALTPNELQNLIAFMRPVAVLVRGGPHPAIAQCTWVSDLSLNSAGSPTPVLAESNLDDPALLLFTSGTTATPKGVLLSFRAILARIALNAAAIGRNTFSKTLATLPVHFGHGLIGNILTPLISGGTVVIPTLGISLAPSLAEVVDQQEITFLSSVPLFWRMALKFSQRPKKATLRRVHVGSAPLSRSLWQGIVDWSGCEVVNCFGITETSNWIAGASSNEGCDDGKVGRMWGGRAAVRDKNGITCPQGEGEILVQTPTLMLGYFQRPDLTASVLSDGWYFTGDIGTVDASNTIVLKGRVKEEINRGGFKIHPSEIDMLLESHPSISESCCFGEPDPVAGEVVSVVVQLASGKTETSVSLRAWCASHIRRQAIPERWYFVDEIPRTSRGKINREMVRQAISDEK